MPRKYYKKRRFRKNKKPTTTQDLVTMAKVGYRLGKKAIRMINSEVKFYDVQGTNVSFSSTGTVLQLCNPSTGDGDNARDGSSIKPARLTLRMNWSSNTTDTTPQRVRLVLFRGKMEKSSTPTISTILQDTSQYDAIVSPKNWDTKFETKILYDRSFSLTPDAGADQQYKLIRLNKKLFGHIKFATDDTAGTDIENGGLYMLVVSDEVTNPPTCTYYSRCTYYDN